MEAAEIPIGNQTEIQNKLYYREFKPHEISVSGKEVKPVISANVIYFGGAFETPDAPSTLDLRQSWADYSGASSFAFLPTEDPQKVYQFIKERGLTAVVLAGYSQGAMRAMELAKLLQDKEQSGVEVGGLVLLEPTGLYNQKGFQLAVNFVLDSLVKTPLGIAKNAEFRRRSIGVLREFLPGGVPKSTDIPPRQAPALTEQIKAMSKVHPGLEDIKVPIVLMQGEHDIVSAHGKVVPKEVEEERKINQTIVEKIQAKRRALGKKWSETKFPKFEDLREKYLKEFVFTKSPSIKMLVPEKAGYHGLPIFRPEEVAKSSLYVLSRWNRQQKSH